MNKRKVKWSEPLYSEEDFKAYERQGKMKDQESRVKKGFLHYWGQSARFDPEFQILLTETYCYVEDEETGKILKLIPTGVTFVKD